MKNRQRIHGTYLCSFCGKNKDQVLRLIAGPRGVYVCDECITRFSTEATPQTQQVVETAVGMRKANKCSFCDKQEKKVQRLVLGPGGVNICDECLALCREIMAEESRLY